MVYQLSCLIWCQSHHCRSAVVLEIKRIHTFLKGDVMTRLGFELAYYDVAFHHVFITTPWGHLLCNRGNVVFIFVQLLGSHGQYVTQDQFLSGHCWRSRDELIRDVLLWIPTHGRAKAGRPARTYIQQLCEDTGCCPEDLPRAMNDREEWRERVRDIRATSAIWWWWWWWWNLVWIQNFPSS